jgi:hypothetical protein
MCVGRYITNDNLNRATHIYQEGQNKGNLIRKPDSSPNNNKLLMFYLFVHISITTASLYFMCSFSSENDLQADQARNSTRFFSLETTWSFWALYATEEAE